MNKCYQYLCIVFLVSSPVYLFAGGDASDGHVHAEEAPVAATKASPRVQTHSETFELVGVVDKSEMIIYLDRYASNEPVRDAIVEVELGKVKGKAIADPDGTYRFKNEIFTKSGQTPVTFTILAGKDNDLLTGNLVISEDHVHAQAQSSWSWIKWLVLLAALFVGGLYLLRARQNKPATVL